MGFGKAVSSSLPALVVAIASAAVAWVALKVSVVIAGAVVVGFAGLGGVLYAIGRFQLSRLPPRARSCIRLLEWAVIGPAAFAAAAAGAVIWLAIDRTTHSSPEDKAIIASLVTAASTFLTTSFVEWSKDPDGARVSVWTKRLFQKRFHGVFRQGTDSQDAAQNDLRFGGWGHDARRKRADVIEANWSRDCEQQS